MNPALASPRLQSPNRQDRAWGAPRDRHVTRLGVPARLGLVVLLASSLESTAAAGAGTDAGADLIAHSAAGRETAARGEERLCRRRRRAARRRSAATRTRGDGTVPGGSTASDEAGDAGVTNPGTPGAPGADGAGAAAGAAPAAGNLQRGARVEFDGRLVQGQTAKSGAIYLFARKRSELRSMIVERNDYRTEILQTVYPERP